jgi:ppGpp synthetase/RelA/SpoT-type nucleotidyltranferase
MNHSYPSLQYSIADVRKAGKALAGSIIWDESRRQEILDIFAIAHSWRDAHIGPMRSMRQSMVQRVRHSGHVGITAGRAKRMTSIRKKLKRSTLNLDQIQDLAGCRAIMADMDGVRAMVAELRQKMPHEFVRDYPYIDGMRTSGYRSHHMVYRFNGKGDELPFDDLKVELQVRTRLQHSWATAVEAVGLFRDEDMKAGLGSPQWLRLFRLMSEEFAVMEGSEGSPSRSRVDEIRALNIDLNAASVLEDMKQATKFMEDYVHEDSPYFLITYNMTDHTVKVHPESNAFISSSKLDAEERRIESGESRSKVVLVDVDKMENLREAYPNYFGDVTLFVQHLRSVCRGETVEEEFTLQPQVVIKKKREMPDLSWFYNRHRRWTEKPTKPRKRP